MIDLSPQTRTEFEYYDKTRCASCGISFYMTRDRYLLSRDKGKDFYCPNGHSLTFGETGEDRLKKKVNQLENSLHCETRRRIEADAQLNFERKSKAAIKGVLKKTKTRISNGVCPCCNRTFQNLHRHMKSKHLDYIQTKKKK